MSLHEANKQRNRERILAAADEIIRDQGLESLSMRYLADYAGVSLRTPYNLFSSKTEIIAELLMRRVGELMAEVGQSATGEGGASTGLMALFGLIDGLRAAAPDLGPVRAMFHEIMLAPEQEMRDRSIGFAAQVIEPFVAQALSQRQLKPGTDVVVLTRHLQVLLLAIAGMWAAGQLTLEEASHHTERSWCDALMPLVSTKAAALLKARLSAGS